MNSRPTSSNLTRALDGVLIVSSRDDLSQAIGLMPNNAVIQVPNDAIMELGQIAANRMNRRDIGFRIGESGEVVQHLPSHIIVDVPWPSTGKTE